MSERRRRDSTVAVGAMVLGAAGLLVASSLGSPPPQGVSALALVAGAGAAATLAARGFVRRLVGAVVAASGAAALVVGLGAGSWLSAVAGAVLVGGGSWAAWRGPEWSRLSERYERQPSGRSETPHALWDALDRGEDPTRGSDDLPQ